jgi:hypothetical protein
MRIQIFISETFNAKGITVDVSMAESDVSMAGTMDCQFDPFVISWIAHFNH